MCNNVHGVLQVNINEGEETKMITMVKTRNSAACTKLFALSQTQRRVLTNYLMLCSHNVSIFFFAFAKVKLHYKFMISIQRYVRASERESVLRERHSCESSRGGKK